MNLYKQKLFARLMAPAGDDGAQDGGAPADRGDDFIPTDEEIEAEAAKPAAPAKSESAAEPEGEKDGEGLRVALEGEGDDEDKGDKDKGGKDKSIPLSRHKAVLEKARQEREALERRLAQYEQGDRVAATNDKIDEIETKVQDLEKQYTKLLNDGEHEKAAEAMAKIRRLEREANEAKSTLQIQAAEARAVERARFDIVVERLESAYPALNPDHEDYDADVVKEVLELQRGYALQNYTPAQALQKAVRYVLGTETKKQETAVETKPRVDKDAIAAERKAAGTKKTVAAVNGQPPALKTGMDSDRAGGGLTAAAVMKMSQDDFNKLTEEQLARLRGDEL